jgi:hypothetical protein
MTHGKRFIIFTHKCSMSPPSIKNYFYPLNLFGICHKSIDHIHLAVLSVFFFLFAILGIKSKIYFWLYSATFIYVSIILLLPQCLDYSFRWCSDMWYHHSSIFILFFLFSYGARNWTSLLFFFLIGYSNSCVHMNCSLNFLTSTKYLIEISHL